MEAGVTVAPILLPRERGRAALRKANKCWALPRTTLLLASRAGAPGQPTHTHTPALGAEGLKTRLWLWSHHITPCSSEFCDLAAPQSSRLGEALPAPRGFQPPSPAPAVFFLPRAAGR